MGSLPVAMLVSELCSSCESASNRGAGSQQACRAQQCDSLRSVCVLLKELAGQSWEGMLLTAAVSIYVSCEMDSKQLRLGVTENHVSLSEAGKTKIVASLGPASWSEDRDNAAFCLAAVGWMQSPRSRASRSEG